MIEADSAGDAFILEFAVQFPAREAAADAGFSDRDGGFEAPTMKAMRVAAQLLAFRASEPREERDRVRMLEFAERHADPFDRNIKEGHLTGSGLVMSEEGSAVLLLHHRKLRRWLQPGGHAEPGETSGEKVASREVAEETGLEPRLHPTAPRPFDVDIHSIPARELDPEHEHLDLRYLFVAEPSEPLRPEAWGARGAAASGPTLRWFGVEEALAMELDPGLKRMIAKAQAILHKA